MQNEKLTRWYQEPMMLLVFGVPITSIIVGIIFVSVAVNTKDSLVSDSYYKDGVSYQEDMAADDNAKRLLVGANVVFEGQTIKVDLRGFMDEQPNTLALQLIHPTLQERDTSVLLQRIHNGQYLGVSPLALPEKRHIWLQSPEQGWRVRSTEFIESDKVFILGVK